MELKTDKEKLRRIAAEAEQLVGKLKDYVFTQGIDDGTRGALTDVESVDFIKLIGKKLEGIDIKGNEDVLSDIITIYDAAIAAIEAELAKNEELADGDIDKFNAATIESFKKVQEALEQSKGKTAGPLMEVFKELVGQRENGTLDEEYRDFRTKKNNAEIRIIEDEIQENENGLLDLEAKTREERDELEEIYQLNEKYKDIKKEIEEIDKKLADPNLPDGEKEKLKQDKLKKQEELAETIQAINEKYEKKDDYKKQDKESVEEFLQRVEKAGFLPAYVQRAITQKTSALQSKLDSLKTDKVRVFNGTTFEEMTVEEYYKKNGNDPLKLTEHLMRDILINSDALKEKSKKVEEIRKINDKINTHQNEENSQNLPATQGEKIGFFGKFKKRMEFFRNDKGKGRFKSFIKSFSKKEDEEVFKKEAKKSRAPSNWKKSILVSAEQLIKNGSDEKTTKANLKAKIFGDWEKDD